MERGGAATMEAAQLQNFPMKQLRGLHALQKGKPAQAAAFGVPRLPPRQSVRQRKPRPAPKDWADSRFAGACGSEHASWVLPQLRFPYTEGEEKIQLLSNNKNNRFEFLTKDELVNLETDKDIAAEAKETIIFTAKNIDVEAEKEFNISAETFQVKTEKEMEISGDKDLAIKGSGVSLN